MSNHLLASLVLAMALAVQACGSRNGASGDVEASTDTLGTDLPVDAIPPDTEADAAPDAATDATPEAAPDPGDSSAPSVALPTSCGVARPQFCNPLDGSGCRAGDTCDLAGDGAWRCAPAGDAATEGAACDGLAGPFCGKGLTCVGTLTGHGACARFCCDDAGCPGATCTPMHAIGDSAGRAGACIASAPAVVALSNQPTPVEGRGNVVTWTTWRKALATQMEWYATKCADVGGYPLMASATHYGGDCDASRGMEVIPAMQDGTAILSYLAYDAFTGHADPRWVAAAKRFGDYLVDEAVTPDEGLWPGVFRSTGKPMAFPQAPDCGIRADGPYQIEPDKIGIAGVALVRLSEATGEPRYAQAALHNATVLAANMTDGEGTTSPWAFRLDWRDGTVETEPVSGNMSYNLRLFDALIAAGHTELQGARDRLWAWIRDVQIPNAAGDGSLWGEFFEDQFLSSNRTAWAPLATASYLLDRREALDPLWREHAGVLLDFVDRNFIDTWQGFPVCIEQDIDRRPYGGVLSTYASAAARWAAATGDADRRARARTAIALLIQTIAVDGCTDDQAFEAGCGGWQEDAMTDRIHNILAVLDAFPEWAD